MRSISFWFFGVLVCIPWPSEPCRFTAREIESTAHRAVAHSDLAITTFTSQERLALEWSPILHPDWPAESPKRAFYGTLAGWGIARTPMRPEEELELARAEHQEIQKAMKTSPAPDFAVAVLKHLTDNLPGAAPQEFAYTLTIMETPEVRSGTVGGGFLYLSRPMYDALTKIPDHAEDRLAFALAHEMGHIVYQHCRLGYQLLKLEDLVKHEKLDEEEISRLKKTVRRAVDFTGNRLRFLFEPNQVYEADLFAYQLCRNAGFDREAGLDVLRQGVIAEQANGNLQQDPAHALLSTDNSPQKKHRPSARDRLWQLGFERDGIVREPQYGLSLYDQNEDDWFKPAELRIAGDEHVVVLVHGMDSSLSKCYGDLARHISQDRAFRGWRILGFQYPGDASLARVGEFLDAELGKTCDPQAKIDFVCHSAGGLVVRYYAEIKGGPFQRIILQGTPNHGSDWVRLRPLIEMKQFFKDLREGYSQAIENAILDGQGQIAHDLQPGSLLLNYLNRQNVNRGRYAIMRGRRFRHTALLGQAMVLGQTLMTKRIEHSHVPRILRERALQSLERFELPKEVRCGDLVVSTESAALEGVTDVQTFKLHHGQLPKHPETIAATLKILKAGK